MSDALSDDASRGNDGQEDVMTPAELIGKLEEEANLQQVWRGDVKASVHRMEIDRIRFVLSSYLQKIETFSPHVLEKEKSRAEGDPSFLSPEEFSFAKEYLAKTETYLKAVALKHMPPNLQTVDMLKARYLH